MSDIQRTSTVQVSPSSFGVRWPVILLGLLELVLLLGLSRVPGLRATPFPAMAVWASAFAVYAIAARVHSQQPAGQAAVWTIGIAMRLLMLPLLPYYSDDIYRYLWDGWVQTQGVNPFLHAPSDPALEPLRTAWHGLINHPTVPTIYPPAAQMTFRLLAWIAPAIGLFKAAWIVLDLVVAAVLCRLAGARSRLALLLYLWSPLLILEIAWSGHLEPLGLLPMLAALVLLGSVAGRRGETAGRQRDRAGWQRGALGGMLLGLGAGVKFAPAAVFPALYRRHGVPALLAAVSVPILLYIPYADAGAGLFAGLQAYAESWEFNAGPYALLANLVNLLPGSLVQPRQVALAIVVTVALCAALRRWTVQRALFWTIGAALLVSPTLHPWYVVWILPFAILAGSRAWLLFSGLVFLSYWGRDAYHETGVWTQPTWLTLLIWVPFLALLAFDALAAQRLPGSREIPGGEQPGERDGR
jgi:hypothetical protein